MKSKWHSISIQNKTFEELTELQKEIPIRASIPQLIEWLLRVGQKQINKEGVTNDNETRGQA